MKPFLLFDADNTLYDFDKTEEIALKKTFDFFSIPFTDQYINAYKTENKKCWVKLEKGEISLRHLRDIRFGLFFSLMGIKEDGKSAGSFYENELANNGIMLDGATEFLEAMEDYKKALITNGIGEIQRKRIESTDTGKYFDYIFISEEIGHQKPDKRFFDIVLSTIGVEKHQALVIGDSYSSDIKGANEAGIKSIFISFSGEKCDRADFSVSSYKELEKTIRSLSV